MMEKPIMTIPEITDAVKALRRESHKLDSDDSETTEKLNQLIDKLENQTKQPAIQDHQSLAEFMSSLVESIEYRHPKISAIVNDLLVKLASMGV
jgi:predicted transcriptional regulator